MCFTFIKSFFFKLDLADLHETDIPLIDMSDENINVVNEEMMDLNNLECCYNLSNSSFPGNSLFLLKPSTQIFLELSEESVSSFGNSDDEEEISEDIVYFDCIETKL